jgi:hypothetical protein
MSPKKGGSAECGCAVSGATCGNGFPSVEVKVVELENIGKGDEITLSDETRKLLESRSTRMEKGEQVGCFLCRFILEDMQANGKLTAYPKDAEGKGAFPVEAKVRHITLEKMS